MSTETAEYFSIKLKPLITQITYKKEPHFTLSSTQHNNMQSPSTITRTQSSLATPLFPPTLRNFQPKIHNPFLGITYFRPKMASLSGFFAGSRAVASSASVRTGGNGYSALIEYVGKEGINVGDDLVVLLYHIQYACKRIATLVASPFNSSLGKQIGLAGESRVSDGSDRDVPKPLDIVAVSSFSDSQKVLLLISLFVDN